MRQNRLSTYCVRRLDSGSGQSVRCSCVYRGLLSKYAAAYTAVPTVSQIVVMKVTANLFVALAECPVRLTTLQANTQNPPISYGMVSDTVSAGGAFDILSGSFTIALAFCVTDFSNSRRLFPVKAPQHFTSSDALC